MNKWSSERPIRGRRICPDEQAVILLFTKELVSGEPEVGQVLPDFDGHHFDTPALTAALAIDLAQALQRQSNVSLHFKHVPLEHAHYVIDATVVQLLRTYGELLVIDKKKK